MQTPTGRNLAIAVALTAVYFVTGKFGLTLAIVHPNATAIWPPAGIALAAFLLIGNRVWPAILLGAFLVNITTAGSLATSVGIAVGNTLEGYVGAYLVTRFANGLDAFDHPRDFLKFIFFSALLSTTISATMGVTCLVLGGFAELTEYGSIWLTWWLGDAMGDILVGPLILLWSVSRLWRWKFRRAVEGVLLMLLLIGVAQIVFGGWLPPGMKNYPLEIVNIPIIIWAAFRFDQREIATGTFILSGIAIWGTLRGYGPFAWASPNESLLFLQIFMGTTAVMALTAAAVVSEHRKLVRKLREAFTHLKTLKGLLPICAWCKKIRNDQGYWQEVEAYVHEHSDAAFTHGICPDCEAKQRSEFRHQAQGS
jgi:integral membrane sensor domain MASE1